MSLFQINGISFVGSELSEWFHIPQGKPVLNKAGRERDGTKSETRKKKVKISRVEKRNEK